MSKYAKTSTRTWVDKVGYRHHRTSSSKVRSINSLDNCTARAMLAILVRKSLHEPQIFSC